MGANGEQTAGRNEGVDLGMGDVCIIWMRYIGKMWANLTMQ